MGRPGFPVYRDEFVLRHTPRRTPMAAFQTVLGLGALHEPTTLSSDRAARPGRRLSAPDNSRDEQ